MTQGIEVARYQSTVYARVAGLGNFNNAAAFREYVDAMIQDGARTIVIDLDQCTGLDSTFMGTMIGFLTCPLKGAADQPQQPSLTDTPISVTIVNKTSATTNAMASLGLDRILDVREERAPAPEVALERLEQGWLDEGQRLRLIRQAHERLVELNPENAAKFAPFLDMLRKDTRSRDAGA